MAASYQTIQKRDPYADLRPRTKHKFSRRRENSNYFIWRYDGTELGKKNARLMAARLSSKQAPQSHKPKEKAIWLKTTHAPLHLLSPPLWLTQQKWPQRVISHHFHSFADAP